MRMRLFSAGLGAGATIALGAVWADSAQAFSLGSPVTVQNYLRVPDPTNPNSATRDISFQGPTAVVVSRDLSELLSRSPVRSSGGNKPDIDISNGDNQAPDLMQFGGIWDIDLGHNSILLKLNSRFGNVVSGDDVYVFMAPDLNGSIKTVTATPTGRLDFAQLPMPNLLTRNQFEIVFPLGFAPGDSPNLTAIPGELELRIDLVIDPTPVPSPVLLPGLVGMGLAVLRGRRSDSGG